MSSPDPSPPATAPVTQSWSERARTLLPAAGVFTGSRLVVLAGLYFATTISATFTVSHFFRFYDAGAYLRIAQSGYPQLYPKGGGFDATAAFFPLFPMVIKAVHVVTTMSYLASGIFVANLSALVAACLIWMLVKEYFGPEVAGRTAVLVAFWPASFVLSAVYSDGLLMAFAAGCLLALKRGRWVLAGVLAMFASATRPNGLVLTLCCAWAAVAAWRGERSAARPAPRLPFVSVLLAPLGAVAYFAYAGVDLGSVTAWFTAEHRGWGQGFDLGHRFVWNLVKAVEHPVTFPGLTISAIGGIVGVLLFAWMLWRRMPAVFSIYSGGILFLAICSGYGLSLPRFCLEAFPLFVPAASAPRLRGAAFYAVVGVCGGLMVAYMLLVSLRRGIAP